MRRVLWATVVYNIFGALLFAFPGSQLGQLAGLPADVPTLYRALLATFVLLFGGAYAWLARQQQISRPMIAFAAIGKMSAFLVIFVCWALGAASTMGLLATVGDLLFAIYFFRWLLTAEE